MKTLPIIILTIMIFLSSPFVMAAEEFKNIFTLGEVTKIENKNSAKVAEAEITLRYNPSEIDENGSIVLPTLEGNIELTLKKIDPKLLNLSKEKKVWEGHSKEGFTVFLILFGKSNLHIKLQSSEKTYSYRILAEKKGILEIFLNNRFKEDANDGVLGRRARNLDYSFSHPALVADSSCTDPASRIDIAIFYTPDARNAAGGSSEIDNEIAFDVAYTNFAYANSGVAHRLNLVYLGLAQFNEPANGVDASALLNNLSSSTDGVLDSIHGLRDSVQADLVSLIYENGGYCGYGQVQITADADTTDNRAFTVVKRSCAGNYLSLAHEVGHNMGAQHDRANVSTNPLNYNYGHIQPIPSNQSVNPWRTVMSYSSPCNNLSGGTSCTRQPVFSNPGITWLGDPSGVSLADPDPEYNVFQMANNNDEVSHYRCLKGTGTSANIWMKDLWQDTGLEPDPATSGEPMWRSPYIWIRLNEDTELQNEHEHENPEFGQTNYIYVKTHNTGGGSEIGHLELYYADASTNLNSPASWNLIEAKSLNINPGVHVSQFEWSNLPGTGHFCLLARWNNNGSSLNFTSVGNAVRGSNDLIWRNVNIVNLLDNGSDQAIKFNVAGEINIRETYLLIKATPKASKKLDWTKLVKNISLEINPKVLNKANLKLIGVTQKNNKSFNFKLNQETKLIGPLHLSPKQAIKVIMNIDTDQAKVKSIRATLDNPEHLDLTFSQVYSNNVLDNLKSSKQLDKEKWEVIGGVSYLIKIPEKGQ